MTYIPKVIVDSPGVPRGKIGATKTNGNMRMNVGTKKFEHLFGNRVRRISQFVAYKNWVSMGRRDDNESLESHSIELRRHRKS